MCTLFPELNAPPKGKEDRPITDIPKKPPHKSLFLVPMSPDPEENVDDDSDTDLQVPVRVSEIRRNVQLKFLGEQLQRRAQIKAYKRQKELENMEQGSTSSPLPHEPFLEPSADVDAPNAEHIDYIKQTSSPPPPKTFPEPPPSPKPQQPEPQPSTSSGIRRTPARTYELDRSISLLSPTPLQTSNSFIAPVVPWSDMGLFLYDIGQRVEKVSSDGHCLMYARMQALKLDHDIHINQRTIANRTWKEINERIVFYIHFICQERSKPDDVLEDVCKYIEEKDYTIPVADLIVGVAANALNINLKINENHNGVKKEIDFEPDNAQSSVTVHLLYSHNSNPAADPNSLASH